MSITYDDAPFGEPTTKCDLCKRLTSSWYMVSHHYDIKIATLCNECVKAIEHDMKGRPIDPVAYNHAVVVIALTRDTTK